jgi:Chaperone for flagella basal body P-ring formation
MTRWLLGRVLFASAIAIGSLLSAEDAPTARDGQSNQITRQEVWQAATAALRERGFREPQLPRLDDVDLPVEIPALAGHKLRVASACWDQGAQRTQFRMECSEPGQCLPFLAYIHNIRVADLRTDEPGSGSSAFASSCGLASESHPAPGALPKSIAEPTLRPGDRATTVFASGVLRITASVTCLDRGRPGDVIRVRNEDGEIFRARISGPARLEAVEQ